MHKELKEKKILNLTLERNRAQTELSIITLQALSCPISVWKLSDRETAIAPLKFFREFSILLVTSSLVNQIATFFIGTQAQFYSYRMACCLLCSSSTHVLPMVFLGLVVSFSSLLPLWLAWDVVRLFRSNLVTYQGR